MPEANENATQGAPAEEKTFTQAQMDAIIGDRLARERAKYADYSELKQKAEAYDQAEELSKSELQKATERAERAEAQLADMRSRAEAERMKAEIAADRGIPAELLRGSDRAELEAHADAIKAALAGVQRFPNVSDGGDGGTPSASKEEIMGIKDARERVRMIAANSGLFG